MIEFIEFVNKVYPSLEYDVVNKAKRAIRDFEEMQGTYDFLLKENLDELSQGDILSELPFYYYDDEGEQRFFSSRAIVLSQSCDIENNDTILLAPVMKLSNYQGDCMSIIKNRTLTYLYYPDSKMKDYYIDFSLGATFGSTLIERMLQEKRIEKIASLSQIGYYMFICKLSIFFTRREDPITQVKRELIK